MITQEEFKTYKKLIFPFEYQFHDKQKTHMVIKQLSCMCGNCKRPIHNIKYSNINEHSSCIEIIGGCKCPHCNNIIKLKNRFYTDGRIVFFTGNKWVTLTPMGTIKRFFVKLYRKLLNGFRR